MRCDDIQLRLSQRMDGERADDTGLDGHVAECADCRAFLDGALEVRRHLRLAPLDDELPVRVPDVMRRLPATSSRRARGPIRWRRALPVAASLVVGMLIGGLLVHGADRQAVVAVELEERILAAQHAVTSFSADVSVEEHNWHPQVPVRRYGGTLDYLAPEQLVLDLTDVTAYPGPEWPPNDVLRVVTPRAAWSSSRPACPTSLMPGCIPHERRVTGTVDRVPFTGIGASALDVIVPVDSFRLGGGDDLGTRNTDGGRLVGVSADVAQVGPLLSAVLGAGNWRELHPADPVELWVDESSLTPRELTVRAGTGSIRDLWASQRGLADRPGQVILRVVIQPDGATPDQPPATPAGLDDAGFVPGPVGLPEPSLPEAMAPYRSGTQPTSEHRIGVATWSDGRAWVRLRGVEGWNADRLFGDLGGVVRRMPLPDGRVVYVGGRGHTIALHTATGLELVLDGTLPGAQMLEIAASLTVDAVPVPRTWVEVANSDLEEAAGVLPRLLVPGQLDGFGAPAVQAGTDHVVIAYAGSGGRELLITQRAGSAVAPPVAADVIGVEVRGRPGRYIPASGELEWVEGDVVVSLRSADLGIEELLHIAERMRTR